MSFGYSGFVAHAHPGYVAGQLVNLREEHYDEGAPSVLLDKTWTFAVAFLNNVTPVSCAVEAATAGNPTVIRAWALNAMVIRYVSGGVNAWRCLGHAIGA